MNIENTEPDLGPLGQFSPIPGGIRDQPGNYETSSYKKMDAERRVNIDPVFRSVVYNSLQFLGTGELTKTCLFSAVELALKMHDKRILETRKT